MLERDHEYFRRMSWYGVKPKFKKALGLPGINHAFCLAVSCVRPWIDVDTLARLPVNRSEVLVRTSGVEFRLLNPMRDSIAKEIYWGRGERVHRHEQQALELFCHLAQDSSVAFDIGANTGLFSVAAALVNQQIQAHAYEIVPDVVTQLWANLVVNDVSSRVQIHAYGLGDEATAIRIPSQNCQAALPSSLSSQTNFAEGTLVRFESLDSQLIFVPNGSRVVFKVDVEGTEDALFRNGQEFLGRHRPDMICEILPEAANVDEIFSILFRNNYRFLKITDEGLHEYSRIHPDVNYHDWLFTTRHDDQIEMKINKVKY